VKKELTKGKAALIIGALLLSFLSASCGADKEIKTVRFSEITEEAATEAESMPTETSHEVIVETGEPYTVPTEAEQDVLPDVNLSFFTNFGLISDDVTIGNLRDRPSTDGQIIGRFYTNTGMEILEDTGTGWYRVTSGGIEGYVYQNLVLTGNEAMDQIREYGNYWLRVDVASLNVRMEPSTDTGVIVRILQGQTYQIFGETDDFYEIYVSGQYGYVSKNCVSAGYTIAQAENWNYLDSLDGHALTVIAFGMQYLGLRYVYGGTSFETGLDCSWFTLSCMKQVGVSLPRTSAEQASWGYAVGSIDEALPGDLLFYGRDGINHVAVYIGDRKILHAAQSIGCVSISAYNYCGEPVRIRRYF